MNRREFTKSLAALGLAPVLPAVPAAAKTVAPAAAAYTPFMYGLGAHMARSKGICSVGMLAQELKLAPAAASAMQSQLLRQGIIVTPNAAGVALASQPYMQGVQVVKTILSATTDKAKELTKEWAQEQLKEPDDPDTPVEDGPTA